jgi:DNA-binding response OmpR family regulator
MRVLVVEDYAPLRSTLARGLEEEGFAVDASGDGEEGEWYATRNAYDAIVLDLMLPKRDGLSVLRNLRAAGSRAPVLILTARDAVDDRVRGLDAGADDYLVKPFALAELLARLRALVRRGYQARDAMVRCDDLEIDTAARRVRRAGAEIELSQKEYALLEYLARRAGQVVSRAEIWEHVYDFAAEASSNVIDVYVGYLRRKLEREGEAKLIHTRRGMGYVLAVEP